MSLAGRDLNLLVALRALLEQGNVTRAGDRLGISQSAMSSSLSRLRRHFGDELLVRMGRDYELTPLARSLLPLVQETLPVIEQALRLEGEFTPATSGRSFDIALSDYATMLLSPYLCDQLSADAPGTTVRLHNTPPDMHMREMALLDVDLLVAPLGFGFTGESVELFSDRFVCIVDRAHPAVVDGRISLAAFARLPQARGVLGTGNLTPYERRLAEIGVKTEVRVTTTGWLPLPSIVTGTELVAIVPERLAYQATALADIAVVEPPFGDVELVEALWWHESRTLDSASRWLRGVLHEAAAAVQATPAAGALRRE